MKCLLLSLPLFFATVEVAFYLLLVVHVVVVLLVVVVVSVVAVGVVEIAAVTVLLAMVVIVVVVLVVIVVEICAVLWTNQTGYRATPDRLSRLNRPFFYSGIREKSTVG
ncbi:hypothetical protein ElyMa_003822700 [Elysia marginata]|uniref:Uncharacterized protein n=1 Tax=Elysia marginata TaxID=1093978 RepID=A0AAV4FFX5_9GAST|nr:hypothetical protein ElyMa_003822700 [Elysia marginata]